ncbi:unnamed protein product [Ectocarpus sp. 12 AP-2014]
MRVGAEGGRGATSLQDNKQESKSNNQHIIFTAVALLFFPVCSTAFDDHLLDTLIKTRCTGAFPRFPSILQYTAVVPVDHDDEAAESTLDRTALLTIRGSMSSSCRCRVADLAAPWQRECFTDVEKKRKNPPH